MRVFADDQLGVEMDGFANGGQVVESLHGNVGFITDAVDVDNDLRRIFLNQFACKPADHGVPPVIKKGRLKPCNRVSDGLVLYQTSAVTRTKSDGGCQVQMTGAFACFGGTFLAAERTHFDNVFVVAFFKHDFAVGW